MDQCGGVDSGRCVQSGSDHSADGNDYQSAAETGGDGGSGGQGKSGGGAFAGDYRG